MVIPSSTLRSRPQRLQTIAELALAVAALSEIGGSGEGSLRDLLRYRPRRGDQIGGMRNLFTTPTHTTDAAHPREPDSRRERR
jgi:hypothetical protein